MQSLSGSHTVGSLADQAIMISVTRDENRLGRRKVAYASYAAIKSDPPDQITNGTHEQHDKSSSDLFVLIIWATELMLANK